MDLGEGLSGLEFQNTQGYKVKLCLGQLKIRGENVILTDNRLLTDILKVCCRST